MVNQPHHVSASLYIGDLAPDVNETTLYEIFSTIGQIASIRVCRESGSRRSLGYAYVNYHSISDAERSLDTLNYTPIKGVPCRIMWSHRDPSLRKSGTGNIYVKNLDKVIDNKALHDTFSLFGNILSCKVATDDYGKSKGYGFVHYETDQSAKRAIEKVNGMQIGSKVVYVGPFKKQSERPCNWETSFTNLYVKQYPETWTEDILKSVFSKYGTITSMVQSTDPKGRRFALVNFEETQSAQRAIQELHGRKTTPDGLESAENSTSHSATLMDEDYMNLESKDSQKDLSVLISTTEEISNGVIDATTQEDFLKSPTSEILQKNESKTDTLPNDVNNQETNYVSENKDMSETLPSKTLYEEDEVIIEQELIDETALENLKQLETEKDQTAQDDLIIEGSAEIKEYIKKASSDLNAVPEDCLYVQRAMTKAERMILLRESFNSNKSAVKGKALGVNLYVKNLSENVTDEMLRETFSQFGTATSAKIMRDKLGHSRGFGFVCFAFPEEATKAVTAMHSKIFHGKPLYVGLAERREHRTARLQQRYRMNSTQNFPSSRVIQQPMVMGQQQTPLMSSYPVTSRGTLPAGTSNAPYYTQRPGVPVTTTYTATSWRRPAVSVPGRPSTPAYPYASSTVMPSQAAIVRPGGPARAPHSNMIRQQRYTSTPQLSAQNFKFTAQARNRHDYQMQPNMAQPQMTTISSAQPAVMTLPGIHPISAQTLAAAHPHVQKQMLGERLFPLVHKLQPELAGKITGMMLEMDNAELLSLLESEALLYGKVNEALGVLHLHQAAASQR